jgi:hypothetical protein
MDDEARPHSIAAAVHADESVSPVQVRQLEHARSVAIFRYIRLATNAAADRVRLVEATDAPAVRWSR